VHDLPFCVVDDCDFQKCDVHCQPVLTTRYDSEFCVEACDCEDTVPTCMSHDDCEGEDRFCAVDCWQPEATCTVSLEAEPEANYCQHCRECIDDADSVTGSCEMCRDTDTQCKDFALLSELICSNFEMIDHQNEDPCPDPTTCGETCCECPEISADNNECARIDRAACIRAQTGGFMGGYPGLTGGGFRTQEPSENMKECCCPLLNGPKD